MDFKNKQFYPTNDAPLEVEVCCLDEVEKTVLEQLQDGWRVAQTRAYTLHRIERMKEEGLSHGYMDEHRPDEELDYLNQDGRLKTVLGIGEQQAVSVMMFDDGSMDPNEMTLLGCPARIGELECVKLPACGEPKLSWAYNPRMISSALAKRGLASGEVRVLDALSLLVARIRFGGQQVQLREVIKKYGACGERWKNLLDRVDIAKLEDSDRPFAKALVVVDGLDECLMGLVAQRLVDETDRLRERLLKAA